MGSDHWTEFLRCDRCGKTGVAEVSAIGAYEDHADLVPAGFKVVPVKYGFKFYCTGCDIPVRP
jgi:hypothetical protein